MKFEWAEKTVSVLESMGHEAHVYEDYSGRGMYGKTTAGIVTSVSGVMVGFALAMAIAKAAGDNALDELDEQAAIGAIPKNWDSMGLDMIYY